MAKPGFNDVTTRFALLALLASLQFAGCFGGVILASAVAFLLGAAGVFVALQLHLLTRRVWPLTLAVSLASLIGVLIALLLPQTSLRFLLLPVFAAGGVALASLLQRKSSRRCGLCNHRMAAGEVTFGCPRCALTVCDNRCWDFEHRRCRLCTENHVPVLPQQDQWWDRHFGPRANFGRCRVCLATFEQEDLRNCGKCGRPQCRRDWDDANGECQRCGWICPDLPESLRSISVATVGHDGNFSAT